MNTVYFQSNCIFLELNQSWTMKRLLCQKSLEENINEIAKLPLEQLEQKLEKMKTHDSEVIDKLVLLGGKRAEIMSEVRQWIAQGQEPMFIQLAAKFKDGKSFCYRSQNRY